MSGPSTPQSVSQNAMFLALTTVTSAKEAEELAAQIITGRLAFCVQIEGPVTSTYWWEGQVEKTTEWRIVFKCLRS